jgi:hypothetical protein
MFTIALAYVQLKFRPDNIFPNNFKSDVKRPAR